MNTIAAKIVKAEVAQIVAEKALELAYRASVEAQVARTTTERASDAQLTESYAALATAQAKRDRCLQQLAALGDMRAAFGRDNLRHLRPWVAVQAAKLTAGRIDGIVLIVRVFQPERDAATGLPWKHVCGCRLGIASVEMLSADEMFEAGCTDAGTGAPLPPESAVVYVDFATWLADGGAS